MAAAMPLKTGAHYPHVASLALYFTGFDRCNAMPIYEYRCSACEHELEKIQRMSDAALTDCPECGEAQLRRLVSAPGFRLKGGGWYETDFKKDGKRNLHDSHSTSAGPAATGESKDTAKPADNKKPSESAAAKPSAA